MRKRSGYVLLEIIISVFIMSIIITCLLSIMAVINRANKNIEDRIELSQQTEEITSQITPLIEESMNIISITTIDRKTIQNLELGKEYDDLSIKLNFKNSEIKRVTRLEYANCNERNLFIEKCCIKAISIYIDIFLKDHIIVVGKTLHSLLL